MWGREHRLFGLSPDDLKQHAWIIGQSGTGKSTLLHNFAVQLIERGYGVCVIDPHATTVAKIVGEVPKRRTKDVVWIEPGDLAWSVGLNPLAPRTRDKRDQIVASVGATFDHLFEKFWGPQSAFVLRGCVGTLLDCPVELNPTLLSVYRLLSDEDYRTHARRFGTLPVRQFWTVYDSWSETKQADAIAPLINKLDALTNSRALSFAFGQVKPKFDARRAMDEQQIVLCNLSKGGMGPEESSIFGSVLVTAFELAGYERADLSEDERNALPPFFLFVDEFQTFGAAATFANVFSESRKAKLYLIASLRVLAYFGWPRAHEDEAERAVRAGLSIMRLMGDMTTPAGEPLVARAGIATGLVVVGDLIGEGAAQEEAVIGETPNLAARLQGLAEPGAVVIAPGTRRLVGGLFELADLGEHDLKGFGARGSCVRGNGRTGHSQPLRGAERPGATAHGRAGSRAGAALGALGTRQSRRGSGRAAGRRGKDRQVADQPSPA